MNTNGHLSQLIAVAGGSGSGKSWLADRLQKLLGEVAGRLSLDDFYLDRTHLVPSRRERINYDHPRSIDWPFLEQVLRSCRAGRPAQLPRYDFASHTRLFDQAEWPPKPLIVVDGLWILHRTSIRRMFQLKIYLECPAPLRLRRRLKRDVAERGRTPASVRRQFAATVDPMHERFVAPQARWADLVIKQPVTEEDINTLAARLWDLLSANSLFPSWMRATFRAEMDSLLKSRTSDHE